jgi:hypothetical protein
MFSEISTSHTLDAVREDIIDTLIADHEARLYETYEEPALLDGSILPLEAGGRSADDSPMEDDIDEVSEDDDNRIRNPSQQDEGTLPQPDPEQVVEDEGESDLTPNSISSGNRRMSRTSAGD